MAPKPKPDVQAAQTKRLAKAAADRQRNASKPKRAGSVGTPARTGTGGIAGLGNIGSWGTGGGGGNNSTVMTGRTRAEQVDSLSRIYQLLAQQAQSGQYPAGNSAGPDWHDMGPMPQGSNGYPTAPDMPSWMQPPNIALNPYQQAPNLDWYQRYGQLGGAPGGTTYAPSRGGY